ncbi:protein transport protein SEC24 [Babesia microti strain RI]|uniref:Protein transport protein SEC24 n=1 Tax=Babesia microti (strain RI) TaxID=1133968 RepID=A0A1R4AB16_BABMR|nr:protein transport protein SEC24 [Babesia microti strain RI]SJK86191.1 protein transport protein SEC24 [Babesia microti strain RI]|eukprot:XP_021338380.1 protein transport protein SEC24 [Babesia microti strain RI]
MSSNRKPASSPFGQPPAASPFLNQSFHRSLSKSAPPLTDQPTNQITCHQTLAHGQTAGYGQTVSSNFSSRLNCVSQEDRQKELGLVNANKAFIRTTCGLFPSSTNLIQKANIPVGAVITPMAPIETNVPVVSHGNSLVIRCKLCRTYINPFIKVKGNGSWWLCNMCGVSNETPEQYIHLLAKQASQPDTIPCDEDPLGILNGSVEFVASVDYMVRPPQPPTFMFVIDVSAPAVQSGMLELVCNVIKNALSDKHTHGSHNNRTLVGIITYDSSVHFYDLNAGNKTAKMLVISDLEDMFLPLPRDILVNLSESYKVIEGLLDNLPSTWKDTKISGNCMGSAISAAHLALRQIGGQMCVFTSLPPTLGEYFSKVSYKESQSNSLVSTFRDFCTTLSQSNISIELFVCTSQPVDITTLQTLTDQTAGSIHYYPSKTHHYNYKLRNELYHVLTRETGWEAVMRVRVSKGWKITNWFGHYYLRGSDLLVLPTCHSDQTFSITFDIQENVTQESIAYFQSALLYTNSDGERRIRVHNFAVPVTDNYNEFVKTLDPEACMALLCHQSIQTAKNGRLADGRNFLQSSCSKICQQQAGGITEQTKMLAMYSLGLLKSVVFRETKDVTPDLRSYHWSRLQSLPVDFVAAFCYPPLYPLHDLNALDSAESMAGILPEKLSLSHENLSQDGAYLLEDGESMYLWIGRAINSQWLQSVFGVHTIENLHPESAVSYIGSGGSTLGVKIQNIIRTLRNYRSSYMPLNIIRQGDPMEFKFYAFLVDDKSQALMLTLSEFIDKIAPKSPLNFQTSVSQPMLQHMPSPDPYRFGFSSAPPQPGKPGPMGSGYGPPPKFAPPPPPQKFNS